MSDTPKVLRGWMRTYDDGQMFTRKDVEDFTGPHGDLTEVQIIPVPEHGFCIRDRVDVLDADDLVDGTYGEVCGYGYNDVIFVDLLEDPMGLGPVYPATHDELRPRKSVTEPERTYTEEQVREAVAKAWHESDLDLPDRAVQMLRGDS